MAQRLYNFQATEATRESILVRVAICGSSGSGKTKTGLILGSRMVERLGTGPLFVVDSENKSALRYAYSPRSRQGYRFKHCPMPEDDYSPAAYMAALDYCEGEGAGVILIDSASHAWNGLNGVLEQVDRLTDNSRNKNAFSSGWKEMTPVHNRFIQRILGSSAHIIFTLRAKTDWVVQENERGKKEPVKLGLAPVQREGVDYEPDLFFDMTAPDNTLVVSKSRCDRLAPGEVIKKPGNDLADVIIEWVQDSDPPTGARTLGEAINMAVAEGIVAAEEKSADKYKDAKRRLLAWCEQSGVAAPRRDVALAQFKDRVSAVAGPKASRAPTEPAPPTPRSAVQPPQDQPPISEPYPDPPRQPNASPAGDPEDPRRDGGPQGSTGSVAALDRPACVLPGRC
jgi:hypothetical protein